MRQGMPFDVAVPNARTLRAIEKLETPAKRGKLTRHVRTNAMAADILDKRTTTLQKRGYENPPQGLQACTKARARKLDAILARFQPGEALPLQSRPSAQRRLEGLSRLPCRAGWILIYKLTYDELRLARPGIHTDLFEG
jgi:mRNA-degrading endonuclease YafQ of YafQ-DinJ toxin-antitoxin module